ncbi:MAG: lysylphosphatidylglycerol synthase domain-containing protein, partial [Anaerolineae bacterium]
ALARRLADRLPNQRGMRWIGLLDAALHGLDALRFPSVVIQVTAWSFLIWLLAGSTNFLTLLALHLPADWVVSFTLLAVLQAGVSVPSSPGKVGIFQYLCQLTLAWFGIAAVQGFAVGVLLYAVAPLTLMVAGGLALLWESWQLRREAPVAVAPWSGEPREPGEAPT